MIGNPQIIAKMNSLLSDELTAINQYIVHAEMCDNWGYGKLHDYLQKRAIDEMKHAETLIGRILFLEGLPVIVLKELHIGKDVPEMFRNDWKAEKDAIASYNDGVNLAVEVKDNGTRDILESTLEDEEAHIDDIESAIDQIAQMTLGNYLSMQVD